MKRVAITGATGTIGRALVAAATGRGWWVRALVRDPEAVSCPGVEALGWNAYAPLEPRLLADVDAVCHLAALIPGDLRSPSHARACIEVNAIGTLTLLDTAAAAGVGRFVLAGSGNAYTPRKSPADEAASLFPTGNGGWYLTSKLVADLFAAQMDGAAGMTTCTLRISSVYGPSVATGVINVFARELVAGHPIIVHQGGGHTADYVLLDDVVEACLLACERPVRGAINIGSGVGTSIQELAHMLSAIVGAAPDLIVVEPASGVPTQGFATLDITRAQSVLGYQPTPLRVGLRQVVDSLREMRPPA